MPILRRSIGRLTLAGTMLFSITLFGGHPLPLPNTVPAPLPSSGAAPSGVNLPAGVGQDWWSQAKANIQKEEYNITWQEQTILPGLKAAYQAPNRAQGFQTYFTNDGIRVAPRKEDAPSWTWGLTLMEPEAGSPKPEAGSSEKPGIHVTDNRIEMDRGWITEWDVNSAEGLEQGFTIPVPLPEAGSRQPAAGEAWASELRTPNTELHLDLLLTGNLHPKLAEDGQAADFYDGANVSIIHYAHLKAIDATGRILPAHFEGWAGGASYELRATSCGWNGGLRIVIDAQEAIYPITVDPLATSASWTASGEAANTYFGWSAATAGDVNGDGYSDVIVGAHGYGSNSGKAYLYLGGPSGLSTTASWSAVGEATGDQFGVSVATAGDVNGDGYSDVIIGAQGYSGNTGKAYLYLGGPSGLSGTSSWTLMGEAANYVFGGGVATAGDVNGDGYSDVIVGAQGYSGNTGKAYLFLGGPSGLATTASWITVGEGTWNSFGAHMSTAGDVNGDGYSDVIVGASGYNNSSGKAYLYLGGPSGLSATPSWTAVGEAAFDSFGVSVATAGDVNGDGYSDVIIGAFGHSSAAGKAYLYSGGPSGLSATASWTTVGQATNDEFGWFVATAGDVNGDGYSDVIVGASNYYNGGPGKAYLYLGGPSGLLASSSWTAAGEANGNQFGVSVMTAGDVNGDGYSDVIVGATGYAGSTGKAYLYMGGPSGLSTASFWTAVGGASGDGFGYSVATAGDVNGDGYSDIIVGASNYYGNNTGNAYLFLGGPSGPSAIPSWTASGEGAYNYFGFSTATAGDVNGDGYSDVVVGAWGCNGYAGKVYLYLGGPSGLSTTAYWAASGEIAGGQFGWSLAAGDVNGDGYSDIIVGAPSYYVNGSAGKIYIYLGGPSGLSATSSSTASGEAAGDQFGISVAATEDVNGDGYSDVVIGAGFYNGNTGKAYSYLGGPSGLSATASWTAAGEAAGDYFGWPVAAAGDVNGDGYSDVVIGAQGNNSKTGKATLYLGGASGLSTTAAWTASGEATNDQFGISAATAGDVNGDGYSDVVIGACGSNSYTGKAYLYLGGASGLSTTASWTTAGEAAYDDFGWPVATAGDVNGDGYSDVILGAIAFSGNAGKAYMFFGGGGRGASLKPQQRRSDDSAPIAAQGDCDSLDDFRLSTIGRNPFGRGLVKVQWESKPFGTSFDGSGLQVSGWTDTGVTGCSLSDQINVGAGGFHWRARLLYNPVTTPFQSRGRWFTPANNAWSELDLRVIPEADLQITAFSDSPDPVFDLENLTYSLTVANGGPDPAANASATVVLSLTGVTVTFVPGASDPRWTYDSGTKTLSATLGTLANGANTSLAAVFSVSGTGSISANGAAATATNDPNAANNAASATTTVSPTADLRITGFADAPDPVLYLRSFTYTLTLLNDGPDGATGVTVTVVLAPTSPAVSFDAGSSDPRWGWDSGTRTLTATLGSMANQATDSLVAVFTTWWTGTVVSQVSIAGSQHDPHTADNTAGASTIVNPVAIGDRVWRDDDGDGIQDLGEPGLSGVVVDLYDQNYSWVARRLTNSSGQYQFAGLNYGASYIVKFFLPSADYAFSPANQGADDALDSDADAVTGQSPLFALVDGRDPSRWDCGMVPHALCIPPDEPCWLYSMTKNGTDYTLNFQDPNQSNQRTGWNIRRTNNPALSKSTWPLVGTNVVDMDQAAPNDQWTDHSGDDPGPGGIWYYQVTTYDSYCPAEGPF